MRWLTKFRLRVRSLFLKDAVDAELDEELHFHLEHLIDEGVRDGLTPTEAREAALREMGGFERHRDACRDERGVSAVDNLRQDVKYALRGLVKSPGFTATAILSLALGIGANTTIFTFVNATLLQPLPYPQPERLTILREQPHGAEETVAVHPRNFLEWQNRSRSFEALALVQTPPLTVLEDDGAEQIPRAQTTGDFFHVFGLPPVAGRTFTEDEMRLGGPEVVVLGHNYWIRRFGADPNVVGQMLPVRDGRLTIVGVAHPAMRIGVGEPDAYTPLRIDPANPGATGSRAFLCYGRLKAGVSVENARTEMTVIGSALSRELALDRDMGVFVSGLQDYLVREGRRPLWFLMAVVAVVLLIGCANLASLMLARGLARRSELAVRVALGASRGRLVTQLLIESAALAAAGGAVGVAFAYAASVALVSLSAGALSAGRSEAVRLDIVCLLFTLGISGATALFIGLVPAWRASRIDPQAALQDRTRGSTGDRSHQRMRRLLVVAEVAMAVVLLVGASLLLRTFSKLIDVDLGFRPGGAVTMNLFLGVTPPATRIALVDQILERVEALPGVTAAGTTQYLPLTGMFCGTAVWLEGEGSADASRELAADCSLVSRGYFASMQIPLVEGRVFDRQDRPDSPRVLIVNESFARRYARDGGMIGRRLRVHSLKEPPGEVIGIVKDVRHNALTSEPVPTVFVLHAQRPGYITNLIVRTAGNPMALVPAIKRAIGEVDRRQAVSAAKTMSEYVDDSLRKPQLYATLTTSFAALAILLAAVGVYGLIAYTVTQRAHEISIRFALGATRGDIFQNVFAQGLFLSLAGLTLGLVMSYALGGVVSTLLYGVTPADRVSYIFAIAILAGVAAVVAALPAYRASREEPAGALRCE
jgi:putative ABC transport system permease protein